MHVDCVNGDQQYCVSMETILVVSLPQRGDSAVILATVGHKAGALYMLVSAGADLNLQNEVRSVTVDTTSCIIPGCPY